MNAPAASILVVDDEPDLRTLYELTLLREGYRVETASSVQEARQQLKDHRSTPSLPTCACPMVLAWSCCWICETSSAVNVVWS